jgi:hypothetical protein
MLKATIEDWLGKASDKDRIVIKIAVDTEEQKDELQGFDVLVTNPPYGGVAYPAYLLTTSYDKTKEGDIVVFGSDDFYPPSAWDDYLEKEVEEDGCLLVNDGITNVNADAVTLPILGHGAFVKLNRVIYNKVYRHMFSDNELYQNCLNLGILKNLRATSPVFEHRHYTTGKRIKDDSDNYNQTYFYVDKEIFDERMKLDINQRLVG